MTGVMVQFLTLSPMVQFQICYVVIRVMVQVSLNSDPASKRQRKE
ncbi:hypothetical protein PROFUN_12770 [Planoprotostelium fungivorum]|uniref:Uncharacterized protein n=1 Tax=Planoprotostelium fungivorum TaxID=1890364 RepID=A0A2P6N5K5_9EUKA|nr:hypothetical protein PROFUN_12770 [Planoprotostelium fungivorum]